MQKTPIIRRRTLIAKHYSFLKSEIDAKELLDVFYERGIIDEDEMEEIQKAKTRIRGNDKLLKIVQQKDSNLKTFTAALRRYGYGHVVEHIFMPINEDQPTDNDCDRNEVNTFEDYPTAFKGILLFKSEEFRSKSNYRYCWLYFYLQSIEKTMKVVLFDEHIDQSDDLEENECYVLNQLNFEQLSEDVYHRDIRQTFPLTAIFRYSSSICKCEFLQKISSAIPDLQYMNIHQVKALNVNCPVHIKAFITEVIGLEMFGESQIPTLRITIADATGKMTVRIFRQDENYNYNLRYLNKQIILDHGITMVGVSKGSLEIHVSRFTRMKVEEPEGEIPYFGHPEEELSEPPFIKMEDFIQGTKHNTHFRTSAYVLAVRRKKSPLVVEVHKECRSKLEVLPNGRINCTECDEFVDLTERILAYDMRLKIGKRKSLSTVEKWMNANNQSAEEIIGLSAEKFFKYKIVDQEKMIRNLRSKLFEFEICKISSKKNPGNDFYKILSASDVGDETSEDD